MKQINEATDRPANVAVLNRWLATWTGARVARHSQRDGGEIYWHDGDADRFFEQTCATVFRATDRTYAQWREDFNYRKADAERRA